MQSQNKISRVYVSICTCFAAAFESSSSSHPCHAMKPNLSFVSVLFGCSPFLRQRTYQTNITNQPHQPLYPLHTGTRTSRPRPRSGGYGSVQDSCDVCRWLASWQWQWHDAGPGWQICDVQTHHKNYPNEPHWQERVRLGIIIVSWLLVLLRWCCCRCCCCSDWGC